MKELWNRIKKFIYHLVYDEEELEMPIERFNGSKLGLTYDESRPQSGMHEPLPDSAIRPEIETPFDRAKHNADQKKDNEPVVEDTDPSKIDESTVDDTRDLAASMNAKYEAKHPPVQITDAHEENMKTIDVNPTIPAGYYESQEKPEEQKYAKSVITEHALPINTPPALSPQVKETLDTNLHDFHSVTKADDTSVSDIIASGKHTEADGEIHEDDETTSNTPEYVVSENNPDFLVRQAGWDKGNLMTPNSVSVPIGYENAKDLTTVAPTTMKVDDVVQDIAPTTHAPVKKEEDSEPALDSIRPTDAASTIVLIAALMEILASQVKDDDDLPTMEQLHFTRDNLRVILGNPQIGKSFFEVFKDMLLASEYADLAFDFMFDGPEFAGMDKQSLIAGAKFAYSHMA